MSDTAVPPAHRMSRADRLTNSGGNAELCDDGKPHPWQAVSFVFESQLLDPGGRVLIRQPNTRAGRVYLVCLGCHCHTYIETEFVGYWIPGPRDIPSDETGEAA
ncbi:hypothetical protein ACIBTV_26765 [Micromonospora sp. NPDC049366]|uniref:hypothetical protein n=1 Tax=Micromonospora sp. NPDC049366 TaxID=3364271 RepID=UPI0037AAB6B4